MYIEQKNSVCSETVSAGLPKLLSVFQKKHFEEKHFSEKQYNFFFFSDFEWETFGPTPRKQRWGCQNSIYVSVGLMSRKTFLIEILSFYDNRIWFKKFLAFCWLTFCGVFKAAFFVFKGPFCRKTFYWIEFWILLTFSGIERKNIDLLPKELQSVWQNLVLRNQKNNLNQKIALEDVQFSKHVRAFNEKNSAFFRKKSVVLSKLFF